jgi:hypothetical protein
VIPAFLNKEVLLAVGLRERHTAIKVIEIAGLAARIRPAGIIDPPHDTPVLEDFLIT